MTADMPDAIDDEIKCIRKRTLDGIERCVVLLLDAIRRDWRDCGKAACARSRRCRGLACDPYARDYET
jgi:hypothetical protein